MDAAINKGYSDVSFVERMIRVSEETDNFTIEDIKAEAITTLTAVRYLPCL